MSWRCLVYGLFLGGLMAQGVGIGVVTPDPAAILHLESTQKGLLFPRLTRVQRDAIPAPPQGLVIYNTTDSTLQYFNGLGWVSVYQVPRMSSAQRNSISNPYPGLVIFNTTDSLLEYYNGRCWLAAYQESCEDCNFTLSLNPISGTIDHVNSDSVAITVTVTQTSGTPQLIALQLYTNLPPHMSYVFTPPTLTGSGSAQLVIKAQPLTPPGTYALVIQAVCGNRIKNAIYTLTIDPCYTVNVVNSVANYNLTAANPSIPTTQPVCVVVRIFPGVEVTSTTTAQPAFTTGSLHPQSVVAFFNEGAIIGKGGAGAAGGAAPNYSNPGGDGGDALHITAKTYLYGLNGNLFGGGGGGASVGITFSVNFPVLGTFSLDFGTGGGGGAGDGPGGTSATPPPLFMPGQNGTGGITGLGGRGGQLFVPINIPLGPVTFTINPSAYGGDGGDYGYPGQTGYLFVCASASAPVPILGTITIPLGCYPSGGVTFQPGGQAGYAIRRIGGAPLWPLPDGSYLTNLIRG
ncbi:MAG: hypothetical protein ACUVRD_05545, partial [Bacteroidia bacterium]